MTAVREKPASFLAELDPGTEAYSNGNNLLNVVPPLQTEDEEYLCYFYHRHLDFRIPEVESLAELAGGGAPDVYYLLAVIMSFIPL
jgi:hypothetical protein